MSQFKTGKLKAIYSPVGSFSDGSKRLRRANFDVLQWAAVAGGLVETYIMPRGNAITSEAVNDQDEQFGMEFGFYNGENLVVEPHMGDGSDNLFGLHMFGYV